MFKPKAQSFRKQIRREYINEYFRKKRKQFNLIPGPQDSEQVSRIEQIGQRVQEVIQKNNKIVPEKGILSLQQLRLIATFSQIQLGVQTITAANIPSGILPYLSPLYYNTQCQHLTTCIFVNVTYIKSTTPTNQFMRCVTNIIENTDLFTCTQVDQPDQKVKFMLRDTVDNCLLIIYHLTLDYLEATKFYIQECGLVGLMYGMFEVGTDACTVEKVLKIMVQVTIYHKGRKDKHLVRKFIKNYLSIFENTNELSLLYLSLRNLQELLIIYLDAIQVEQPNQCQHQMMGSSRNSDAQAELHGVITQILKSRILQKINHLYPHIASQTKTTRIIFFILKIMLPKMQRAIVQKKLLPILNRVIDTIYRVEMAENDQPQNSNLFTLNQSPTETQKSAQSIYIRTQFYQIIYALLQIWPSDHDILVKHPLFQKICDRYVEFEQTNASDFPFAYETRQYFVYIFGMLVFSGKLNPNFREILKVSIQRLRVSLENSQRSKSKEENASLEGFLVNVEQFLDDLNELDI